MDSVRKTESAGGYRYVALVSFLIGSLAYWKGSTVIFRFLASTDLRFEVPAIQIAVILAIFWLSPPLRIAVALGLTGLNAVLLVQYRADLAVVAFGFFAGNALCIALDNMSRRDPKEFAARILTVGLSLAFGVGAAELFARVAPTVESRKTGAAATIEEPVYRIIYEKVGEGVEWTTSLHSVHRANAVMRVEGKEYTHSITFNAKGLRGPELSYDRESSVFRILLLGDSFVEAVQVKDEDLLQTRVADMIRQQGLAPDSKRIEVFGAGVSGWGTLDQYLFYRHEGYRYRPDLVVLVFITNDPINNLPLNSLRSSNERSAQRMVVGEDEIELTERKESPADLFRLSLQRILEQVPAVMRDHSALWAVLYKLAARPVAVEAVRNDGNSLNSPILDEAWRNTEIALRLLRKRVKETEGDLVLVSVPSWAAVPNGTDSQTEIDSHLADICNRLGIPWFSLLHGYQEAVKSGVKVQPEIFGVLDSHWTASGHRLTGKILSQWLLEQKLLR